MNAHKDTILFDKFLISLSLGCKQVEMSVGTHLLCFHKKGLVAQSGPD